MSVQACRPPILGDQFPRPVGLGRSADGEIRFVVTLCPGERLASFRLADRETERPVWKVSGPDEVLRKGGEIVLGKPVGFAAVELPLQEPLPRNIVATVWLADGFKFESAFLRGDIPRDLAGTDHVLDGDQKKVSEEEFGRQVRSDYCRRS